MRNIKPVAAILLASTLVLAACGQKGPLFLPEDQAAQAQDSASTSIMATDEKDESTQ